jgi:hypothetical protein
MKRLRLTAWGVPAGAVLALLWGLALGRAQAQVAAGVKDPGNGKIYTRSTIFDLPVNIDERARGSLRKVILFVKIDRGTWSEAQTASPTQNKFHYRATQDGEYWFSVVTVDHSGVPMPRDVSKEPAGLMVVVDTQPPTFELQPATLPGGQPGLRCIIHDATPDYQSLKISYRSPDGMLRFFESAGGRPGYFRLPGTDVLNNMVQVSATDRAGNQATRDINLKELMAPNSALTPIGPPAPSVSSVPAQPDQQASASLPTPPATPAQGETSTVAKAAPSPTASLPMPQASLTSPGTATPPEAPPQHPVSQSAPARNGMPTRQVLNTKHAAIEYQVDPVGPSGIGKVEIWMTADKGASWQRVGEDVDRRSPAEIDLPGEGLFGIRLVVSNGNGFGGQPPTANDAPHTWVEVDTTLPTALLHNVEPLARDGKLEIRWTVTDKNLLAEPIDLYYATKQEGPWQPIARGLHNDGSYLWAFPHDQGNQFFVRLEASDEAGNRREVTSPMPVVLDMTEPHALVVGVTGVNPAPSQGH